MCKLVKLHTNANNCGMVADIKKDYILNIIKTAALCSGIDRIILFGSSLEERCTPKSDIDIAVFGNKTLYQMLRSKEYRSFTNMIYAFGDFQDYDILYFQSNKPNTSNIMAEINKGFIIYQKEDSQ